MRQRLVERARETASGPPIEYVYVDLDGNVHGTNGIDIRDHSFVGRSRAEAVVALHDYWNEHYPSPEGYDNYDCRDGSADELDGWVDAYFEPNDQRGWLLELRPARVQHRVAEVSNAGVKAAGRE